MKTRTTVIILFVIFLCSCNGKESNPDKPMTGRDYDALITKNIRNSREFGEEHFPPPIEIFNAIPNEAWSSLVPGIDTIIVNVPPSTEPGGLNYRARVIRSGELRNFDIRVNVNYKELYEKSYVMENHGIDEIMNMDGALVAGYDEYSGDVIAFTEHARESFYLSGMANTPEEEELKQSRRDIVQTIVNKINQSYIP